MSARHSLVVVNPRGGTKRGLAVLQQVRPVLEGAGLQIDVRVTQRAGHAEQIVATAVLGRYDNVCVIGGDGTIHEVANGLLRRASSDRLPLGFIPAGSGNTLHQHLNLTDPIEAAKRIVEGRAMPLDVARVTIDDEIIYCLDVMGWGAVAEINHTAEALRLLGPSRYAVGALWHIARARRYRARVILDGRPIDDQFLFAIACNVKFTAKGMMVAPRADVSDGKFDVVVVRKASRAQMLKIFSKVFDGSHVTMECVEYHQVRSFGIETAGREPLDIDGEMKGQTPFHAEVLPGALRVFA